MINIDNDLDELELYGDVARQTSTNIRFLTLPELLEAIRTKILPKLLMFESPAQVANELPDTWLVEMRPTLEWAMSHGDKESADALATRMLMLQGKVPPKTQLDEVLADGRTLIVFLQSEMVHFREYRDGHLPDEPLGEAFDLVRSWIAELSDPAGQSKHVADTALRDLVARYWPSGSKFGPEAAAFEFAAARLSKEHR